MGLNLGFLQKSLFTQILNLSVGLLISGSLFHERFGYICDFCRRRHQETARRRRLPADRLAAPPNLKDKDV